MKGHPLDELAKELGRRPPAGLATLPRETLDDLAAAVREARARQARGLLDALDAALRIAPRPLRSVLRKVLVG